MNWFRSRALWGALCFLPVTASAFDATYLKMAEPKGWKCTHEGLSWVCFCGDSRRPSGILELRAELMPMAAKYTMADVEAAQRKVGSVTDSIGRSIREELRLQRRVTIAGLDWAEAVKWNSVRAGMAAHQWDTVLPTQHGPFVITINAAYRQASYPALDRDMTASMRTLHLSRHVIDYVEYLSIPEGQRDAALPQVVVGTPQGAKIPSCPANRRLEMTVGSGRMVAFPLRLSGVAVIEKSRSLELLPTHVPYVMSTLLFSPMAEGRADVYVFDRSQKCRMHYAVGVQPDSTRLTAVPREWTSQPIRTPSSAAEADAEYARLATAAVAGHLETGNPVAAIPFPDDGTMWVSDPRIFETLRMKPGKDRLTRLLLIAKRPGTTTLVALDGKGRGRGFRVTVDTRAMRVESMAIGQYESQL